jgi:RNA polymerase sigma-70 factor (ECF subfamily)
VAPPTNATADPSAEEELLVDALRARRAWAERAALSRFTPVVRRVLLRILGTAAEVDDLCQEVFLRALDRLDGLRAGVELRSWFTSFAVNVAREMLRKRARRRWLLFFAAEDLPEPELGPALTDADVAADLDARQAVRAVYAVLGRMRVDLRTAFALRHLEGMDLQDVARACQVSLATIKRRLEAAETMFRMHARRRPELEAWLGESERWR